MNCQVTVLFFIMIARFTSCLHVRDDTAFMDMIDQLWLPSGDEFNCTKYRLLIEEFTGVFTGDNEAYYRSITCLEDDGNYSVYYTYQREPVFTGTRSEYLLTLPVYTDGNATDYSDISDELDTSNPLERRAQLTCKNRSYHLRAHGCDYSFYSYSSAHNCKQKYYACCTIAEPSFAVNGDLISAQLETFTPR